MKNSNSATQSVTVRFNQKQLKRIRIVAKENGVSVSDIVRLAVTHANFSFFKRHPKSDIDVIQNLSSGN